MLGDVNISCEVTDFSKNGASITIRNIIYRCPVNERETCWIGELTVNIPEDTVLAAGTKIQSNFKINCVCTYSHTVTKMVIK